MQELYLLPVLGVRCKTLFDTALPVGFAHAHKQKEDVAMLGCSFSHCDATRSPGKPCSSLMELRASLCIHAKHHVT